MSAALPLSGDDDDWEMFEDGDVIVFVSAIVCALVVARAVGIPGVLPL